MCSVGVMVLVGSFVMVVGSSVMGLVMGMLLMENVVFVIVWLVLGCIVVWRLKCWLVRKCVM